MIPPNHKLCAGIDPNFETRDTFVKALKSHTDALLKIANSQIIPVIKPNLAFFLSQGSYGIEQLEKLCESLRPYFTIILDCKCNEIANSLKGYLHFAFKQLKAHGITVNPFLGESSIELAATLAYQEQGPNARVYVLCATSEYSQSELSALQQSERIISAVSQIAQKRQIPAQCLGLVIGANRHSVLKNPKLAESRLSLLIPGIGAQGGTFQDLQFLKKLPNECTYNISRAFFQGGLLSPETILTNIEQQIATWQQAWESNNENS